MSEYTDIMNAYRKAWAEQREKRQCGDSCDGCKSPNNHFCYDEVTYRADGLLGMLDEWGNYR